jgi:hypothetical protein
LPSLSASATWTRNQFEAIASFPGAASRIVIIPQDQFDAVLRVEVPLIDTTRWFRALATNTAQQSAAERDGERFLQPYGDGDRVAHTHMECDGWLAACGSHA